MTAHVPIRTAECDSERELIGWLEEGVGRLGLTADRVTDASHGAPDGSPPCGSVPTDARPIGSDAPKHSVEWSNYTAATIAAREVRGRAIHSEAHRISLAAWERGERSWPWPDPTEDERRAADAEILALSKGLRRFNRENRGRA